MINDKKTVELVLEGVELTAEAKAKIEAQMAAIITEKTGKRVAFILERTLAEAKLNIYRAVKERAKSAYMEALGLIRGEMQNDAVAFKTQLEEKLNDFLNYSMKKLIPDDIIKEASQAKHYKELVEKVKKVIVALDSCFSGAGGRSVLDPAYSLTIFNSSSSLYTLKIMTVVALLFMPVVIAYQIWVYRVFRGKLVIEEVLKDREAY